MTAAAKEGLRGLGIRLSVQPSPTSIEQMENFVQEIKEVLEIVSDRTQKLMFRSTRVVGVCRECCDLQVIPDDRMSDTILWTETPWWRPAMLNQTPNNG